MKTRRILIAFAALLAGLLFSARAFAVDKEVGLNVNYFDPTDNVFKAFYKGTMDYGLQGRFWWDNGFGIAPSLDYISASRKYAARTYNLAVYSLEGGLLYSLKGNRLIRPYFGVGLALNEATESAKGISKKVSNFEVGYVASFGFEANIKWFRPYFQIACRDVPADVGINVSGWSTGVGIQFAIPQK